MKANELRIGNYVTWIDQEDVSSAVLTVVGIYLNDSIWLEWQWEDGTSDNTDCGFDSVRPIPLTEEWILKFGAEKQTQYQFVHGRFRLIWKPEYKYWYVIHNDTLHYMNKIEFVHEWQNFMFVMGSEELQIQEP